MEQELLMCYNKGCGQKFKFEDNSDTACVYHPGGPIFHDALKGWSCCKKRVSDFTEFLNIKGCTIGFHSNVKPPEPDKQGQQKITNQPIREVMYQLETQPQHKQPATVSQERPSADDPLTDITTTIGQSLKTHLERLSLNSAKEVAVEDDGLVKIGTSCQNKGCRATFEGEHSHGEKCVFHPGVPVFHEGMKYWTCCQRKTSDFDAFLNQEGCEVGVHMWHKKKLTEEKQVRVDWHQTSSNVCISIFAKCAQPEKTKIQANQIKCHVSLVYEDGGSSYNKTFILREAIIPSQSEVKLLGTKVEINLKKAEAFSWSTLECTSSSSS